MICPKQRGPPCALQTRILPRSCNSLRHTTENKTTSEISGLFHTTSKFENINSLKVREKMNYTPRDAELIKTGFI
jgi:hypothetical protein